LLLTVLHPLNLQDSQLLEAMQQLEAVRDELTKITCEKESLQNDLNRVEQLLSEAKAESDLLTKTGVKREVSRVIYGGLVCTEQSICHSINPGL
jgi:chromosome segregation ATPase